MFTHTSVVRAKRIVAALGAACLVFQEAAMGFSGAHRVGGGAAVPPRKSSLLWTQALTARPASHAGRPRVDLVHWWRRVPAPQNQGRPPYAVAALWIRHFGNSDRPRPDDSGSPLGPTSGPPGAYSAEFEKLATIDGFDPTRYLGGAIDDNWGKRLLASVRGGPSTLNGGAADNARQAFETAFQEALRNLAALDPAISGNMSAYLRTDAGRNAVRERAEEVRQSLPGDAAAGSIDQQVRVATSRVVLRLWFAARTRPSLAALQELQRHGAGEIQLSTARISHLLRGLPVASETSLKGQRETIRLVRFIRDGAAASEIYGPLIRSAEPGAVDHVRNLWILMSRLKRKAPAVFGVAIGSRGRDPAWWWPFVDQTVSELPSWSDDNPYLRRLRVMFKERILGRRQYRQILREHADLFSNVGQIIETEKRIITILSLRGAAFHQESLRKHQELMALIRRSVASPQRTSAPGDDRRTAGTLRAKLRSLLRGPIGLMSFEPLHDEFKANGPRMPGDDFEGRLEARLAAAAVRGGIGGGASGGGQTHQSLSARLNVPVKTASPREFGYAVLAYLDWRSGQAEAGKRLVVNPASDRHLDTKALSDIGILHWSEQDQGFVAESWVEDGMRTLPGFGIFLAEQLDQAAEEQSRQIARTIASMVNTAITYPTALHKHAPLTASDPAWAAESGNTEIHSGWRLSEKHGELKDFQKNIALLGLAQLTVTANGVVPRDGLHFVVMRRGSGHPRSRISRRSTFTWETLGACATLEKGDVVLLVKPKPKSDASQIGPGVDRAHLRNAIDPLTGDIRPPLPPDLSRAAKAASWLHWPTRFGQLAMVFVAAWTLAPTYSFLIDPLLHRDGTRKQQTHLAVKASA